MTEHPDIPHYRKLRSRHPEFMTALEGLGGALKQAGPLDEAQAQLIQLAAAAS